MMATQRFAQITFGKGQSWEHTACACCYLPDEYCACKRMRSGPHKGQVPTCSECYRCPTHHRGPWERCA
jgi:hypothetical protein